MGGERDKSCQVFRLVGCFVSFCPSPLPRNERGADEMIKQIFLDPTFRWHVNQPLQRCEDYPNGNLHLPRRNRLPRSLYHPLPRSRHPLRFGDAETRVFASP